MRLRCAGEPPRPRDTHSRRKQAPSGQPGASAAATDPARRHDAAVASGAAAPTSLGRRRRPKTRSDARPAGGRLAAVRLALAALLLAAAPAAAVRIDVTDCLPNSMQSSTPTPLQWRPLYADARFDTQNDRHNLQFIVWGNVTGSQNHAPLPPPGDAYWADPKQTNGKIIETANPEADNSKATTVYRRVNVLTYEPWHSPDNFCKYGLVNGSCPLGPVFHVDKAALPYGLPSVNLSHDFFSSYSFSSFAATVLIIYGDSSATNIGCMSATITPDLGGVSWVLKLLPLVVLLFSGFAVILAAVYSPWGTTNIFHWSSNNGRDADLLRLVTPGFGDCLQYIQFIVLTGGLSLSYPGFYQPVVSQAAWSALMFNQSFVTNAPAWQSVVDGVYVTNATAGYGLHQLGQLTGLANAADIWPGMMVWLSVILVAVFVLVQAAFLVQWLWRRIKSIPEEDLRAKNIPFSIGNVVRVVLNYMLLPIVALSAFQLVVAPSSPAYTVALAVVTLVIVLGSAAWILVLIIRTRPKSVLFDDLPTVLRYGPLYNTYSDEAAAFALIPVLLNFLRGIAIGAVQPSGVAQVVLLAICEVIQIFTLHAFRPFQSPTSMNAYHTLFSSLRAITILLMVAFVPSLGVTEGPKGWIGYAILLVHGGVLALGFFLSALQTVVEVVARMLGAGGDDVTGLTRGGLSKIFGMRQLSRRETHRTGPSRASQLSSTAMLDAEEGSRVGYMMPGGRVRSSSTASLGALAAHHRHRSSSAFDSSVDAYSAGHRNMNASSSYVPGTPGETSPFSFLGSPNPARHAVPVAVEASDPYYRPPRRRRDTLKDALYSDLPRGPLDAKLAPQAGGPPGEAAEAAEEISRGATPAPPNAANSTMNLPATRPDYSTREVDFYYGVRGPALNSEGPGRKLGTGPADPTGPVATATGWFRNLFSSKTKEKGKGFEVVRSKRMPAAMVRNGGFGDETPPEGIPVAMGVLRNGPIDSDDDDEPRAKRPSKRSPRRGPDDLLTDNGDPQESEPEETGSPAEKGADGGPGGRRASDAGQGSLLEDDGGLPVIPRKNSKRNSGSIDPRHAPALSLIESGSRQSSERGTQDGASTRGRERNLSVSSTLPFGRPGSQRHLSSRSSLDFPGDLADVDLEGRRAERPASFGTVPHHGVSRVDPERSPAHLLGSAAELVDDGSAAKRK